MKFSESSEKRVSASKNCNANTSLVLGLDPCIKSFLSGFPESFNNITVDDDMTKFFAILRSEKLFLNW